MYRYGARKNKETKCCHRSWINVISALVGTITQLLFRYRIPFYGTSKELKIRSLSPIMHKIAWLWIPKGSFCRPLYSLSERQSFYASKCPQWFQPIARPLLICYIFAFVLERDCNRFWRQMEMMQAHNLSIRRPVGTSSSIRRMCSLCPLRWPCCSQPAECVTLVPLLSSSVLQSNKSSNPRQNRARIVCS